MKYPIHNQQAEKISEINLSEHIFDVKAKPEVVHQVVVAQFANSRQPLAHTKDKGEVRGGGRKPWRQKGTGRARHGSIRSPLWIGGGVTFGPTKDRNFSKKVNKRQKQVALAMCLSDKRQNNLLVVFDEFKLPEGKTKQLKDFISTVKNKIKELKDSKKFLLVLDKQDKAIVRSSININNARIVLADSLNCVDLLKYDTVLMTQSAVKIIEKHYCKIRKQITNNR